MDVDVRALLDDVAAGRVDPEVAHRRLEEANARDLGFARIDTDRIRRRAYPEVIYCPNKTPEQVVEIIRVFKEKGQSVLATRADDGVVQAVREVHPEVEHHAAARCLSLRIGKAVEPIGSVVVVSAGTADIPVAEEAAVTAEWAGARVERIFDVGVAGLHRLIKVLPSLRSARAVVVVAGMEGALPSVVGGLVDRPIVAVPTSVGYGMNLGGAAALLAMLNSCAPGVTVVNVDNGFGAGVAAALINRIGESA
ncbi:MAG TPA: nickel pincer cofactor biosynthesis protein LarB [Kiritimatiellia bacterium]|nr:nickel pincer cofactor biosynthesis protein LarB [Kiritimatiellia bacterium]